MVEVPIEFKGRVGGRSKLSGCEVARGAATLLRLGAEHLVRRGLGM